MLKKHKVDFKWKLYDEDHLDLCQLCGDEAAYFIFIQTPFSSAFILSLSIFMIQDR